MMIKLSTGSFRLAALLAGLGFMFTGKITAQTFTVLHDFTGDAITDDGGYPVDGFTPAGTFFYGTTASDEIYAGKVFRVNPDGTGFTTLFGFSITNGAWPNGGLVLTGNTLYGTDNEGANGGAAENGGNGAIFKLNTDGTGFTNLYLFSTGVPAGLSGLVTNRVGSNPGSGLVLVVGTLYGTAFSGGTAACGTVFSIATNGTDFTVLHTFAGGDDGALPQAGLLLANGTFYGTTAASDGLGNGTVYKINPDGTGYAVLYEFTGEDDGAHPYAGLILVSNMLYGTADGGGNGGNGGNGTVYKVNPDGSGFTTLYQFSAGTTDLNFDYITNSDGANPFSGLTLFGNTLYGVCQGGGASGDGTVYQVNTDGTGFAALYDFSGFNFLGDNITNSDGLIPLGNLLLYGGLLYGTAYGGGTNGVGTMFNLTLGPELAIEPTGTNLILSWPTNALTFTLQVTTNLAPPVVWTAVTPAPVAMAGLNSVTNAITGVEQFYRLGQ